jgi:ubiquinone biosynthesis protein COQ9
LIWQFADDAWYVSGDRATDYNHYTKRLMFCYIYVTSELHMLTDKSTQFEQTWEFMERRLQDTASLGSQAEFAKHLLSTVGTSGYYLMTMFRNFPLGK